MLWIHGDFTFIILVFLLTTKSEAVVTKYLSDKACVFENVNDDVLMKETSNLAQCSIHCHVHKCDRFEFFESGKFYFYSKMNTGIGNNPIVIIMNYLW